MGGRGHVILKKCSDCGLEKPIGDFNRRRTSSDGRMSYCSKCNSVRTCAWQKKTIANAKVISRRLAWRQKHPRQSLNISLTNALKRHPTALPITLDELCEIWEKQRGLCALSGVKMTWAQGKLLSTSITLDRINHEDGYKKDNIRLLCHAVNALRGRMTDADTLLMAKAIVAHMEPSVHIIGLLSEAA